MLTGFFDDSGTHPGASHTVLGGLLGTEDHWAAFNERWRELLRSPLPGKPPLNRFHLAECRAGGGPFIDYKLAERDRLTYLFRKVIIETELVTMASAVDNIAWNDVVVGQMRRDLGEPGEYAFVKCTDFTIGFGLSLFPIQEVRIVIDQGWQSPSVRKFASFYMAQPKRYPTLRGIEFRAVSDEYGLQGADMIATETYWHSQRWAEYGAATVPRPHFADFVYRDLSRGLILERDAIEEMADRYRRERDPRRWRPENYKVNLQISRWGRL